MTEFSGSFSGLFTRLPFVYLVCLLQCMTSTCVTILIYSINKEKRNKIVPKPPNTS